jgi:hypothetical protein
MKKTLIFILAAYAMLASAVKVVASETLTDAASAIIVLFFCIGIIIWHMCYAFSYTKKEAQAEKLFYLDFHAKLYLIPFYILILVWGFGFAMAPFGFIFLPFLIILDYIVLLSSSAYGLAGLIHQRRTLKISPGKHRLHSVMHVLFFLDFWSSFLLWNQSKHKDI